MTPEDLSGKKVVIISDLHLGKKFNEIKFAQINSAVSPADKLIINGDLWEGFAYTLEEFLTFDWRKLFGLFKNKEAVYLYGNHDREYKNDSRTNEFSVLTSNEYDFIQNGVTFHVRHGDKLAPTLDMRLPRIAYFYWFYEIAVKIERFCIQNFGKPFLHIYRKDNEKMIAWKNTNLPKEHWLICAHSHLAVVDKENHFANSGIFEPPVATYLVVENGEVSVV
ncbi:MAG: metallophosphoesterase [Candidatus Berkelbacteria bacterium]|nr:MAG: metallophosphoesterase [Candidatus Berkelbacteria bacterium]QQG51904.1 MAG: metallophosphoesterase [Candidatus Berkelbacteria bacterium]